MPAHVVRRAVAAFVVVLVPLVAAAQQNPGPEARVLPNYDVRRITPSADVAPTPDVLSALDQLRVERGPGIRARMNPLTHGARVVAAGERPLSTPAADRAENVSRRFLRRYARLFGLQPNDIDTLILGRDYSSPREKLRHVSFAQRVRGIPVFGAQVLVHLNAAGEIVNVSTTAATPGTIEPATISSADAVLAATADIRPDDQLPIEVISGPVGPEDRTVFAPGPFRSPIEASRVLFPMRDGVRPAWRLVVEPQGFPQKYEVVVDARSGAVVYRRNMVLYATGNGRVLQSDATSARDPRMPDGSPLGANPSGTSDPPAGCPPVANHVRRPLTAPFRDPTTVLFNTGRLQGNNTHVYRVAAPVEGASGSLQPDGSWQFDFAFNTADAAETQLFFGTNFLHDFFYDLGFDEAAGNFQVDNFGRGGLGGDSLNALARASGRNNATFQPTADGQSPTMSMFLWDATGCWGQDVNGDGTLDLDATIDSDVYIHEFHHGVSTRLNTQWSGPEAEAIGEGGSDFFAYSINDDTNLGEYSAPPLGIRHVNDKTYGSWTCTVFWIFVICEPHDNGEIWANVMWDLRQRFIDDSTGGRDAAIHAVHQLYVDGLKLSPPQPTMLDLRDAMLQADLVSNPSSDTGGSINYCRIWDAFALRGMGAAASDTNDTGGRYTVAEDFTVPAQCPAPPGPPIVTIAAPDASAAEAGLDPGEFVITRTGDLSAPLTVYTSVSGTATDARDYVSLPAAVEIPQGSATVSVIVTPIDDTLVEANETVVLTVSPATGYRVGHPSAATVTIVSDDLASDLVVSSLSAPAVAAAGGTIAVSDTTKNQGAGPAAASTTRFYLSAHTVISSGDPMLATRAVPALAPSTSSSGSVTLTIPSTTAPGTYFIVAQADGEATNQESSESNNTTPAAVRIGPDLVVTVTAPPTVSPGVSFVLNDTTRNQGGGDAAASVTKFFLSIDTTFDASDVLLGSRAVAPLAPAAGSSGTTSVAIPGSTPAGTYYIIARADSDDVVPETTETNNTGLTTIRTGADLTVTISAPMNAGAGTSILVTDTVKNQGTAAAGGSTTRLYLSTNPALDGSDLVLGSRTVPALTPSASSSAQTLVTIPPGTATGTYYLFAQADADGAVVEMSEANNTGWAQIRIGPDLAIASVSGPGSAAAGGTVAVTDVTKNQGTGTAPPSTTRFYLAAHTTLGAGDVLLGSRAVPELAAGASSTATTALVIPASTATGTWFIIAQADGENVVAEMSEFNNTAAAAVRVGPDLLIAGLSAPLTITAGTAIAIADVTANQGGGAAGASTTRYFLSVDYTYNAADIPLGDRSVPALAGGSNSGASTSVTIPTGTAAGRYYLIAVTDADGAVAETIETNNTRLFAVTVVAGS